MEMVDSRFGVIAVKRENLYMLNHLNYSSTSKRGWFYVVDTHTGYCMCVLPSAAKARQFIKEFYKYNFTYQIVPMNLATESDVDHSEFANKLNPHEDVLTDVCVYISQCGKFRLRSWKAFVDES